MPKAKPKSRSKPAPKARAKAKPKARVEAASLSVLRTEDVPLQEVSGVCLRREAGGDMALVAFGTGVRAILALQEPGQTGPFSSSETTSCDLLCAPFCVCSCCVPSPSPSVAAVTAALVAWPPPLL